MTEPVLFCRIGWMPEYCGLDEAISGAGAGREIQHEWESYNFKAYRGHVYGYVAAPSRSIDIGRLGGSGDSVSGVLVVWVSLHPTAGRQRIVGWYRNATVYRALQDSPSGRSCSDSAGNSVQYHVVASEADAHRLLPAERTFIIPQKRGFFGRAETSYMASEAAASLVRKVWAYVKGDGPGSSIRLPDEVPPGRYVEGATTRVTINAYERDPRARRDCIDHWGTACSACGESMGDVYGGDVHGLIHVHHLKPLSSVRRPKSVDPIEDLRPVCPNCHAVIHHSDPPLTIDAVRVLLKKAKRGQLTSRCR